eukprot:403942-Hanusia_phi.AAC.4
MEFGQTSRWSLAARMTYFEFDDRPAWTKLAWCVFEVACNNAESQTESCRDQNDRKTYQQN